VVERCANEAYDHYRALGRDAQGRRLSRSPKPYEPPKIPAGKINTTYLDSRNVKTPRSYTQGYNAQAVVNENQIVLAAEVSAAHRTSVTSSRWFKRPRRNSRRSVLARLPESQWPTRSRPVATAHG
jgi:hypothetical protein